MKTLVDEISVCFTNKNERRILFGKKEKRFCGVSYVKVNSALRMTFTTSRGNAVGILPGIYANGEDALAVAFGHNPCKKKGRKK